MDLIRTEKLEKVYDNDGVATVALDGVDLRIGEGEIGRAHV